MRTSAPSTLLLTLATFAALGPALTGCTGEAAPPTASHTALVASGAPSLNRTASSPAPTTAAERWNLLTRQIVGRRESGPPRLTRTFALVSVAQYDAAIAAATAEGRGPRPSESGASAGAAAGVLAALYPVEQAVIDAQLAADASLVAVASEDNERDKDDANFAAGVRLGGTVAAAVMARAGKDGSSAVWTGTVPTGPGLWVSAPPPAVPVAPLWGQVRPWLMKSGDQFRPAPPPVFGSPAFLAALAEVRRFSDTRTPGQLAIAQFWGASTGTAGPMGYWSGVALDLTASHRLGERATARVLALMSMAGMDATIGCWDAKYTYWYIRPFQADPAITTPVGRPNFPSYPSAHSCISSAAAGVLMGLFPAATSDLRARVDEAGMARIYAGLHYSFDIEAAQQLGYSVAALALHRGRHHKGAIPLD